MARTVSLIREGRIGSRTNGTKVQLEIEDVYQVLVDSVTDSRYDILYNTPGLPQAGISLHPATLFKCSGVSLAVDPKKGTRYIATATYSSQELNENNDATEPVGDPTEWVPLARVEFEPIERVVAKDLDGKPYLNSVGDPFETGLIVIDRIPVRVFTQYEPVDYRTTAWAASTAYRAGRYVTNGGNKYLCIVSGTSASSGGPSGTSTVLIADGTCGWKYVGPGGSSGTTLDDIENRCDTVNSVEFMGRAAKTLLLETRSAEIGKYFGYSAWKIEYAMKYNKRTWVNETLDMGYRYKEYDPSVSADVKKPFVDKDTGAVFLGKLNGSGDKVSDQIAGDPAVLNFRVYDELDFKTFIRMES